MTFKLPPILFNKRTSLGWLPLWSLPERSLLKSRQRELAGKGLDFFSQDGNLGLDLLVGGHHLTELLQGRSAEWLNFLGQLDACI